MLIDIDRIVVGNRIRKDFGDIEELAEDIRENGLINPPVVNKNYELLAGERRLRACKILGWPQIEVRMMDTRDAEHELNIEISENDVRKGFTKSERVDYIRRLLRIEQAKAKERQVAGTSAANATKVGRSDELTAQQFDMSAKTMRRELFIADNKDLLDPADFAEWDEGKLSTNKAFQRIKAAKEQAERERDDARDTVSMVQRVGDTLKAQRDQAQSDLEDAKSEIAALEKQNDELYELANNQQVVEREVVRTVAPDDYEDIKKRLRELEGSNRLYIEDNESLRNQLNELEQSNSSDSLMENARRDAAAFVAKYSDIEELAQVFDAIDAFLNA